MRTRFIGVIGLVVGAAGVLSACGDDEASGDKVGDACSRIVDAACAKFVECKVLANGRLVTSSICSQAHDAGVDDCKSTDGSGISAAVDAEIDACVDALAGTACTSICNQVPKDPPACLKFGSEPSTETISCAP